MNKKAIVLIGGLFMESLMIKILKEEVKPATGCTEPVAVAFAVAKAREAMVSKIAEEIDFSSCCLSVRVSPNLFKNGLGVGIPNCKLRGLAISGALGLFACQADDGLKVFEKMTEANVSMAQSFLSNRGVALDVIDTSEKVRVEVMLKYLEDRVELVLSGTHDCVASIVYNGEPIYSSSSCEAGKGLDKTEFYKMGLKDLIETIAKMPTKELAFLNDGLVMNRKMAMAGLSESMGMGVGYGIQKCVESGEMGSDLVTRAMCLTAAASDARMSGLNMTVMSSNGSGNNGLTAILPLVAYFETHEVSEEEQLRALAMSHLINCYVKERIGRLSAMCSCAISAATGSGAAIAWLMSHDVEPVLNTIQNMTGNLAGMICDGAKEGCALKLATGAATGVQAALLAVHGVVMPSANGIVGRTAEESIAHLGILSQQGMQLTDHVILDIMKGMI
jgi:L-cysteine desulfidase